MDVTPSGIVTDFRLAHPLNTVSLISFTLFGIEMLARLEQPENAFAPSENVSASSGRLMLRSFGQLLDALVPIFVSAAGA